MSFNLNPFFCQAEKIAAAVTERRQWEGWKLMRIKRWIRKCDSGTEEYLGGR